MKKIVIIGPESAGKSTLCQQLAEHYNTLWCPEYAREYLLTNGKNYNYEDLLIIAKGQLALEDLYAQNVKKRANGQSSMVNEERGNVEGQTHGKSFNSKAADNDQLLFLDTDMYVMKVWSEFVFGKYHQYIGDQVAERKYDLYLLCNVDLPWVEDELREYPDLESREKLYNIYKEIMLNQAVPWVSIHGNYEQRFELAVSAVDLLIK